jgi:hypothetical protein
MRIARLHDIAEPEKAGLIASIYQVLCIVQRIR